MSQTQRQMHLAGFLIAGPVAHNHTLWRHPSHAVPFLSVEHYVEIARLLERGRFDLLFFADRFAIADRYGGDKTVGLRYGDQDATRLDPMPIAGLVRRLCRRTVPLFLERTPGVTHNGSTTAYPFFVTADT